MIKCALFNIKLKGGFMAVETKVTNGVNVNQLTETIDMVKENPDLSSEMHMMPEH